MAGATYRGQLGRRLFSLISNQTTVRHVKATNGRRFLNSTSALIDIQRDPTNVQLGRRLFSLISNHTTLRHVKLTNGRRFLSSTSGFIDIQRDPTNHEIAVLKMNSKPVNVFSPEFVSSFRKGLQELEDDESCRGLIITSALPDLFTGGIDLNYISNISYEDIRTYCKDVQDLYASVIGSRLITIAAINGQSPAGGCVLSLGCEYRIFAQGNYVIGMNEVALNIAMLQWISILLESVVGPLNAERAILRGRFFKPEEALNIGLVDHVVPANELLQKSINILTQCLKVPDLARKITKRRLREAILNDMTNGKEEYADQFADCVVQESVKKTIQEALEKLKERKRNT
ncbi:enoyl-CoA delta isomerase 1, mitochondrial-like [Glandiceps talaboti]